MDWGLSEPVKHNGIQITLSCKGLAQSGDRNGNDNLG